jgi:hypothetical protein
VLCTVVHYDHYIISINMHTDTDHSRSTHSSEMGCVHASVILIYIHTLCYRDAIKVLSCDGSVNGAVDGVQWMVQWMVQRIVQWMVQRWCSDGAVMVQSWCSDLHSHTVW